MVIIIQFMKICKSPFRGNDAIHLKNRFIKCRFNIF
jgi:hypothetical protein